MIVLMHVLTISDLGEACAVRFEFSSNILSTEEAAEDDANVFMSGIVVWRKPDFGSVGFGSHGDDEIPTL